MPQDRDQQSVIWPSDMQDDPMNTGVDAEDDFSKFLDLDNDFNFAGLDNGHSGIDTPMGRLAFGHPNSQQPSAQDMQFDGQPMSLDMPPAATGHNFGTSMHGQQQYSPFQQQYHQMQMPHGYHIPPTPVSSEMHAAKYPQHVDATGQLMFERQQVSFTPLVSPAQTPLTHAYSMPQYGTAEDFFSPLTSPAIEAQQAYGSARTTASPVDLNAEQSSKPTSAPRKTRRRGSTSKPAARSVKQSPLVKAQRRRKASLTNLTLDKANEILNQANRSQSSQNLQSHGLSNTADNSGDDVSPRPLSEGFMRPPPVPTADRSQHDGSASQDPSGSGVTPSTLMSMPSKQGSGRGVDMAEAIPEDSMEDMMLPDAAAPDTNQTSDLAHVVHDDLATPTMSAKAAKTSSQSTPRGVLPKSASSDSFNKPAKIESRPGTARGKKRGNTTASTLSPALRPKISPSISPLVPSPGTGLSHVSAETNALYLASKSNYQNIIDGTHLPGVSYPEALAENLSSKRTSHKIAEQGRRNRINLALKEIEGLLPPSIMSPPIKKEKCGNGTDGESSSKNANAQGASKASTVEMAIIHIKNLQAELDETKARLATAEKKLAEGSNSSAGSQASE